MQNIYATKPLGNDDCWSAGTRIESGLDKNQNGELDANEIQQSSIQCGPNLFTQGLHCLTKI